MLLDWLVSYATAILDKVRRQRVHSDSRVDLPSRRTRAGWQLGSERRLVRRFEWDTL